MISDHLARESRLLVSRDKLHHYLQLMVSPSALADPAEYKYFSDECDHLRRQLQSEQLPWLGDYKEPTFKETAEKMAAKYTEEFMDPNTPEFAAELKKLKAYWASGKDDDD